MDRPSSATNPSPVLVWAVVAVLAGQFLALVVLTTRFDPETAPESLTFGIVLASGIAAIGLGYDATRVDQSGTWWNPRAWVWAFAMLPFALNLGFALAYLVRRIESGEHDVPWGKWIRLVVAGAVLTGMGTVSFIALERVATLPTTVVEFLRLATLVALGTTIVAAYYDVTYVNAVLEILDERWMLNGLYWVPLVSILSPPINVLFAALYVVRRRRLLNGVEESPSALLEREWSHSDG